jgi:myo-inositol-1(or 4)-monophosphatase
MPARGETFTAVAGAGAYRNGELIRASARSSLEGGLFAGPRSTLEAISGQGLQFEIEPRIPSLAYRLARVAEGSLDVGIASTNAYDWDIAAADLMIHEAGGCLTSVHGATPTYNRRNTRHELLVASPTHLHDTLIASLKTAIGV